MLSWPDALPESLCPHSLISRQRDRFTASSDRSTPSPSTLMRLRHLITFLPGLYLLTGSLEAQISGIVRDVAGMPLADVTVEVWGASPRPVGMRTDQSGSFYVSGDQLRGAARLSFRRMGYQTRIVTPEPVEVGSVLEITLDADPVLLDGITVVPLPERAPCPNREQAAARHLWETARARYAAPPAGSGYRAILLSHTESVADPRRDPVSEERMQPSWRFWGGDRDDPFSAAQPLDQRVRERGYAWELPWRLSWYRSFAEEYFAWNYAQLFTFRTDHFVSDAFGQLHTLSLVRSGAADMVIAFCPVGRGLPSIQGQLRLGRDTALVEARWSYRTPRPSEDAGAEMTFRPLATAGPGRPLLVAESSTFWRRMAGRQGYARHSYVFLDWEIGPGVRSWSETVRRDR